MQTEINAVRAREAVLVVENVSKFVFINFLFAINSTKTVSDYPVLRLRVIAPLSVID